MNEELKYFLQGEDIDTDITIYEKDGVTPLDMSSAIKFFVHLLDGYRNRKARYKSGTLTSDWRSLDISQANIGMLSLNVFTEVTKNLAPGHYYFEVRVQWNSGIHTDDSRYDLAPRTKYAFTIEYSNINLTDPLP